MSLASKLGKYAGIIAAESMWLFETGFNVTYYVANAAIEKVSEMAKQHAIDSDDPEKVTDNIFNCLELMFEILINQRNILINKFKTEVTLDG